MIPKSELARVLLTGGTSQVGVFALPALGAAGEWTISLSRRIAPGTVATASQSAKPVTWLHPGSASSMTGGAGRDVPLGRIELFLSCGPVHLAAELIAHCPRLVRVVCISSSSVLTKSDSPNRQERELISGILAAETELQKVCALRNIELTFLRPTLIYGCGLDRNVSRLARVIRRLHFMPVAGRASGLRQPIHATDVAAFAVKALLTGYLPGWDGVLKGGSMLTYREMVERTFLALGHRPRIVSVPPGLLGGVLKVVSRFPGMTDINAEFALRQNQDLAFADPELPGGVQFTPRPFVPVAADFAIPAEARAFQPG